MGSLEGDPVKRRNSTKYGYYMLLTIATPDVHDHLSDREVSTVLFLPAKHRERGWRTSSDSNNISGQWILSTIQENLESSGNLKFRAAVQFMQIYSKID